MFCIGISGCLLLFLLASDCFSNTGSGHSRAKLILSRLDSEVDPSFECLYVIELWESLRFAVRVGLQVIYEPV